MITKLTQYPSHLFQSTTSRSSLLLVILMADISIYISPPQISNLFHYQQFLHCFAQCHTRDTLGQKKNRGVCRHFKKVGNLTFINLFATNLKFQDFKGSFLKKLGKCIGWVGKHKGWALIIIKNKLIKAQVLSKSHVSSTARALQWYSRGL